ERIRALIDAGTDVMRLNFSHGTIEWHADVCSRIRRAATDAGRFVAVLQDLSGPKIRIGALASPISLEPGGGLAIELGDFAGGPGRVSTTFDALFHSVSAGARLLLDDGRIELDVTRVSPGRLETRVITGGLLESHKGINAPGVEMKTPAMTAKDATDLAAGIRMGVDLVAVSFVQSADDLRRVRAAAAQAGAPQLPLVAKIEKPHAVERVESILDACDALMVARGDLGIEMPLETIPAVQRRLVVAARRRGAPVIVATQVLESMRSSPRPTRAEVTDAAEIVEEGADGVLLTGETAIGRYPEAAVSTLDRILREAERSRSPASPAVAEGDSGRQPAHARALAEAAVALAARANARAIVALTGSGHTALVLAALRPAARILALTPNPTTASRLAVVWGVQPILASGDGLDHARGLLRSQNLVGAGSVVVFVAIGPDLANDGASNFVHAETL
ncbi:MAG TPA: pyruvate kinase, partial [Vicinamibacterales bacterium]|nr:pyruvate kinase [Vicinamibacterales bacterium]